MRRVLWLLAIGCVAVLCTSSPAATETGLHRLIRGGGIGKVQIGMPFAKVRAALGRPHTVVRTDVLASGGRYVEYSWEVEGDLGPDTWTVGLRSATRTAPLRVVRVSTTVRSQRTREGLGVGARPRQIVRTFRNATCVVRDYSEPYRGMWIVVEQPSGTMTAFLLDTYGRGFPARPASFRAIEVLVQASWYTKVQPLPCDSNWQRF